MVLQPTFEFGSEVWACNKQWQTASLESLQLKRCVAALLKRVMKQ